MLVTQHTSWTEQNRFVPHCMRELIDPLYSRSLNRGTRESCKVYRHVHTRTGKLTCLTLNFFLGGEAEGGSVGGDLEGGSVGSVCSE